MTPLAYNYLGEIVFNDDTNIRYAGKTTKKLDTFDPLNPARFLLINPQNKESSWLCGLSFALQQGQRIIQIDDFFKICTAHLSKTERTQVLKPFIVDALHAFYRAISEYFNPVNFTHEKLQMIVQRFDEFGLEKSIAKIPELSHLAQPYFVLAYRYTYLKNKQSRYHVRYPYFDPLDGRGSYYATNDEHLLPWSISPEASLVGIKPEGLDEAPLNVSISLDNALLTINANNVIETFNEKTLSESYSKLAANPIKNSGRYLYQPITKHTQSNSALSTSLMLAHKKFASTLPENCNWINFVKETIQHPQPEQILSAEQMDAVAIATLNFNQRKSFILADETGLGKGRTLAALVRAFILRGKKVVFITEKKHLFSDFWRDLDAVSQNAEPIIQPFIFHPNGKIIDSSGNIINKSPSLKKFKEIVSSKVSPSPLIFTTYSQFNRDAKHADKYQLILEHLQDALLILDESHNASGQSQTKVNIKKFIDASSKCVFSSATYAKHEQAFELYSSATPLTKNEMALLISSFQAGDTIATSNSIAHGLVSIGAMVRREHLPDDSQQSIIIEPNAQDNESLLKDRDTLHTCLESIFHLQGIIDYHKQKNGEDTFATWVTLGGTLSRLSKQFNILSKIKLASSTACNLYAQGFKPVIAMESTFEAFQKAKIKWLKNNSISIDEDDFNDDNDEILEITCSKSEFTIGALFTLAIESIATTDLLVKFKDPELERAKNTAIRACESMPKWLASPIDCLLQEFKNSGLTVGEVSGRSLGFTTLDDDLIKLAPVNLLDREKTVSDFNNGKIDALILTQAGASGISLHASETFKDQRKRAFIELEICSNPTQRQQFLGRVRRKGQVVAPSYYVVTSGNPYEHRLIERAHDKNMLLAGLTSASQDTTTGTLLVGQKIMSDLGDMICLEWLESNVKFAKRLGIFITPREKNSVTFVERTLKRIALLPSKIQDELFDFLLKGSFLVQNKPLNEKFNPYINYPILAKSSPVWGPTSVIVSSKNPSPFETSVFAQEWCCNTEQTQISSSEIKKILASVDLKDKTVAISQLRPQAQKALKISKNKDHIKNLNNLAEIAQHLNVGSKIRISHPYTGRPIDGIVTDIFPPKKENWATFSSQWGIQAHFPNQPFFILTSLLSFFSDENAYIANATLPPDSVWDKKVTKPLHFTTIDGHCGYSRWYANQLGNCITQKFTNSNFELLELPSLRKQETITNILNNKIPLIDPRLTLQLLQRDTQLTLTTSQDDNPQSLFISLIPVAGGWLLTCPRNMHDQLIDYTLEKRLGPRKFYNEGEMNFVARFISITNIHAVVTMLHHKDCRFYCPASRKKWHASALEMLLITATPSKSKKKARK